MTYLSFLFYFLGLPLIALSFYTLFAVRRGQAGATAPNGKLAAGAQLVHVFLAVAYTTPWDNYLVATRVWWYDPARVLGLTLGWVPLEEYLFFVLQPLVTGLFLFALLRRWPPAALPAPPRLRLVSVLIAAGVWLAAVTVLALGWQPGTYLGLELAWALPPIMLQLAVGADLLWRYRSSVLVTLAVATLYLSAADWLAIQAGVWTIDPAQSLNLFLGGVLPLEEVVFFLLTNTLVVFGLTLTCAPELRARTAPLLARLRGRRPRLKPTFSDQPRA